MISKQKVDGTIVRVTADTACSGNAFAGYDTLWIVDELQIRPRYSLVSKYNTSGKMEIVYDTKGLPLHKIFLVGMSEDDKKQIWPVDENAGYRVIKTDCFSVEIPEGWSATADQDANPLLLNLHNEAGVAAGSIEMLPEGAELMPLTVSDSFQQKIHENAETGQKTIVTIFCTEQLDEHRAIVIADMMAEGTIE